MSLLDLYPWLKALHVASALMFVGGVLAVAVFLRANTAEGASLIATARVVRRWDQTITTPAMLLVWGFGIVLAISGHWFADLWLQTKLVFVVVLSAIHGLQSGRLRRLAGGADIQFIKTAPVIVICVLMIAILAVVKPG